MKPFRWSAEKNEQLKAERGLSFERLTIAIENDVCSMWYPIQDPQNIPGSA